MHNSNGKVYTSIYLSKEGYPTDPSKAFKRTVTTIVDNKCSVLFDNIPKGVYAIACYHDENDNKKLDTYFIGIPTEGTGASNNAKGFFGPPKFNDAEFNVSADTNLTITINY